MRLVSLLVAISIALFASPVRAEGQKPVEPWARVLIEVGLDTTTITLTSVTNRMDPWAESAAKGYMSDSDGCAELVAIQFNGAPLCNLFHEYPKVRRRDWSHFPRPTVHADGEQVTISLSRTLETETGDFLSPRIAIGPAARPRTVIDVTYGKSLELYRASPLPAVMKPGLVRFRIGDLRLSDRIVHVDYNLFVGANATDDGKRAERLPLSLSDMVPKGSRLLSADELARQAIDIGRVLTALVPVLLVMGLLRTWLTADDAVPDQRRAITLCRRLTALILVGFLGIFVMTDRWMSQDAPDWLRAAADGLTSSLQAFPGNWTSLLIELMATVLMAILKVALIALLLGAARRMLRKAGWVFGLPIGRPLSLALLLIWIALPLPFLLDALETRLDRSYPGWPYQAFQASALLPTAAIVTLSVMAGFALFGRTLPRRIGGLILFGTLICMVPAVPMFSSTGGVRPAGLGSVLSLYSNVGFYLTSLAALFATVPLLWMLWCNRQSVAESGATAPLLAAGALLLALIASAPAASWLGLLCVALALWLWPVAALTTREKWEARKKGAQEIGQDLPGWVSKLERAAELDDALRSSATTGKLATGEMTPTEWAQRRDALESARDAAMDAIYVGQAPVRDLLLGISRETDPWQSGLRSLRYASPVIVALTLLMIGRTASSNSLPILFWITNLSQTIIPMAGLAILFGYYFDYLRGPTGLHKALYLGATLCLVELPAWSALFVDGRALAAMLWSFSQHFLILLPAGVAAFDYSRMRSIRGHRFDWRQFTWFGDARLLSAGVAAAAAAIVPTIATLFSAQFADAVKSMATIIAPILPVGH